MRNIVLHNQEPGHDKVYFACIRAMQDGKYEVIGKWGKRGASLSSQTKVKTASLVTAISAMNRLASERESKKGYVNIESPSYRGPLRIESPYVQQYLEKDTSMAMAMATPKPVIPTSIPLPAPTVEKDFEVVCVDAKGLEHFVEGVTYVAAEVYSDGVCTYLKVYDDFGLIQVCFPGRFRKV